MSPTQKPCDRRRDYHHNNDVWHLRRDWSEEKPHLVAQLRAGKYRFREQRCVQSRGEVKEIWAARDALVLKALAIVLTEELRPHLSPRCFHLAGTGGLKGAVREVDAHLPEYQFVFRSDVKGYYASIDHDILYGLVAEHVRHPVVLDLVRQYLQRFVSDGGIYTDIEQGISLGCPLSPLMGALYLKPLDDRMAPLLGGVGGGSGCFYVRFMDDWLVLAPTRWQLRKAVKATNQVLDALKVEKHPQKTFVGRIAKGFDFLGYFFSPRGLEVAVVTVERFIERVLRLYEQNATASRIEEYARRWLIWVRSGVQKVELGGVGEEAIAPFPFNPLALGTTSREPLFFWLRQVALRNAIAGRLIWVRSGVQKVELGGVGEEAIASFLLLPKALLVLLVSAIRISQCVNFPFHPPPLIFFRQSLTIYLTSNFRPGLGNLLLPHMCLPDSSNILQLGAYSDMVRTHLHHQVDNTTIP